MSIYNETITTEYDEQIVLGGRRAARKAHARPDQHIPNKHEGQLLRKMMQTAGVSEEEIRAVKGNRVKLAQARISGTKARRTRRQKALDNLMKGVTRELKLAKEHPLVVAEFKKRLAEKKRSRSWDNSIWWYNI